MSDTDLGKRPRREPDPPDTTNDGEEEELVRIDFPCFANRSDVIHKAKDIKFDGLMTDTPTCVVDGVKFVGRHEHSLGTQLVYQKPAAPGTDGFRGLVHRVIIFEVAELPPGESHRPEREADSTAWRSGIGGVTAIKQAAGKRRSGTT